MCLLATKPNTINRIFKFWKHRGYKVFDKNGNNYSSLYHGNQIFEMGKEYRDCNNKILKSDIGEPYLTGYHIFRKKYDAKFFKRDWRLSKSVVVEVEYSNIVANGEDLSFQVDVARKMKLIKEVSK